MFSIIFPRMNYSKRISLKRLSEKVNPERSAEIFQFRFSQPIVRSFLENPWDACTPFFDDMHVLKSRTDSNIAYTGIAGF